MTAQGAASVPWDRHAQCPRPALCQLLRPVANRIGGPWVKTPQASVSDQNQENCAT